MSRIRHGIRLVFLCSIAVLSQGLLSGQSLAKVRASLASSDMLVLAWAAKDAQNHDPRRVTLDLQGVLERLGRAHRERDSQNNADHAIGAILETIIRNHIPVDSRCLAWLIDHDFGAELLTIAAASPRRYEKLLIACCEKESRIRPVQWECSGLLLASIKSKELVHLALSGLHIQVVAEVVDVPTNARDLFAFKYDSWVVAAQKFEHPAGFPPYRRYQGTGACQQNTPSKNRARVPRPTFHMLGDPKDRVDLVRSPGLSRLDSLVEQVQVLLGKGLVVIEATPAE